MDYLSEMTEAALYSFLVQSKLGVVGWMCDSSPQAALVGIAVTPQLEVIFDTVRSSRKYRNLVARPACSFVIGWSGEQTVQYEGTVREIAAPELERSISRRGRKAWSAQSGLILPIWSRVRAGSALATSTNSRLISGSFSSSTETRKAAGYLAAGLFEAGAFLVAGRCRFVAAGFDFAWAFFAVFLPSCFLRSARNFFSEGVDFDSAFGRQLPWLLGFLPGTGS